VVDGSNLRVGGGQLVGDGCCPVLRAVVDDDDLELLGEGRQGGEGLLDEAAQVGLLVVRREEVGEGGDAGHWAVTP
jgi:hypothetical protein